MMEKVEREDRESCDVIGTVLFYLAKLVFMALIAGTWFYLSGKGLTFSEWITGSLRFNILGHYHGTTREVVLTLVGIVIFIID